MVFSEGADANKGLLDIGAWVSIVNQSGATYPDAKLKLIAGEVNRAPQPMYAYDQVRRKGARTMAAAEADGCSASWRARKGSSAAISSANIS